MANNSENLSVIILAAGQGVRMRSPLAKVLHNLKGKPLINYVLRETLKLKNVKQVITVVGHQAKQVVDYSKDNFKRIEFVVQKERLGTAHAVKCALGKIKQPNVLVLCADAPLITSNTLTEFIQAYLSAKLACSLITALMDEENDLGKIQRDAENRVKSIVEKIEVQSGVVYKEVNSGIYCFDTAKLKEGLGLIQKNPKKGEYFLTDILGIFYGRNYPIGSYQLKDNREILGINSPKELACAEKIMQGRINEGFMNAGVRMIDPTSTFIEDGVKIGQNTVIFPFTYIEKNVIIGDNCSLGPFIRLRKGTVVANDSELGNFLEVNRCRIGKNVKIKHFCYLGDAEIGENVNIGAGTVIANYDGKNKNKSVIEKGAFIGSDTVLVAPVKVGKGAATGAGSVVTHDVKPNTIVVGVPAREFKKRGKK
jgi:bifunctional UDP-N-acetylglucosamine pyrophosphorylase/glucosamine-1-phosphate N-acetyltransferase